MDSTSGRLRRVGIIPAALLTFLLPGAIGAHAGEVTIVPSTLPPEVIVSIGDWYAVDGVGGTFRTDETVTHLEVALYDPAAVLEANGTPFRGSLTRSSGDWPDGPENEDGVLGCEVVDGVLCDRNTALFGKPDYHSLRLFGGALDPDSVYQVEVGGDMNPAWVWIHPLREEAFTMSTAVLRSGEASLTTPVYGPASVFRTLGPDGTTRFTYIDLDPDVATGLKDDYPVQNYGQRPGSHGNGDFGWFVGYALGFRNEGPDAVVVALFMNTGFTGPSGAPTNTLANDTFWKGDELVLAPGDSGTAWLSFAGAEAWSISDNPFPHTAGGLAVPNGSKDVAINVFDRLQVSAIGWEVRAGGGSAGDASLLVYPVTAAPYESAAVPVAVPEGPDDRPSPRILPAVPNPFRTASVISFEVPDPVHVRLAVYDVAGRLVRVLEDRRFPRGPAAVRWDGRAEGGREVPPGVYYMRLDMADRETRTGRLVRIP